MTKMKEVQQMCCYFSDTKLFSDDC